MYASYVSYQRDTWLDDTFLSIGMPLLLSIVFSILAMYSFRSVRRIKFYDDLMIVKPLLRKELRIGYSEIVDSWGMNVRTTLGVFTLGKKNSDVFQRLLSARIPSSQINGHMRLVNDRAGVVIALSVLFFLVGLLVLVPIARSLQVSLKGVLEWTMPLALFLAVFVVRLSVRFGPWRSGELR